MDAGTGVATITISLAWPFDQNDDVTDTYWGQKAYDYYKLQEEEQEDEEEIDIKSISMKLELRATQIE